MKPVSPHHCNTGAALVGLVAAVLLFSVLAAAIVPMVSSSSRQGVSANLSAKAYLLAESGYRYAASEFLHAGATEQAQNDRLDNLDGNYNFSNANEHFNLEVFSYFYTLDSDVNNQTQFNASAPGNFPGEGSFPEDEGDEIDFDEIDVLNLNLKLRIGDSIYTLAPGATQLDDNTVTFYVDSSLAAHAENTPVYPVADVDIGSNTALSEGGNLSYEPGDAAMFPLRNGTIQINGRTLTYRFNNRNANQFEHVRAASPPELSNFDLTADPEIMLTRYVRLHATGIYGSIGDPLVQRRVVYYTGLPLTASSAEQREFTDRFASASNWSDTSGTFTASREVGGDNALTVDSTPEIDTDQRGGLTTFSPGSGGAESINFNAAHRGTRGFLSYDTQIKVGYELSPLPYNGYFPTPVPSYVGAGLSFRLGSNANLFANEGYGLSVLRGDSDLTGINGDGIPDELVPLNNERILLLWRQTNGGAQRTWLAYKRLADVLLDEDNETEGTNAFSQGGGSTNLWNLEPVILGDSSRQRNGSTRNWYYGIIGFGSGDEYTYNWRDPPFTGSPVRNTGHIRSNFIDLPADAPQIFLTFWSWHETEPGRLTTHDLKQIYIQGSPSATYTINAAPLPGPEIITPPGVDGWYQARIDLSAYAGQTIRISFNFDTVDAFNNDYEGWYIDDVQLHSHWTADTLQDATLALVLKEAMVVPFTNGDGQIYQGNRIRDAARESSGTVLVPPLISSGSWGCGDASGILLLNDTTVIDPINSFIAGDAINVPGGSGSAIVSEWNSGTDAKADIIQVFMATSNGRGTGGNNDPLDGNTAPYGRLGLQDSVTELQWPPALNDDGAWADDNGIWTAETVDYFQLIQWDAINSEASGLSDHAFTAPGNVIVNQSILQSSHPDLRTEDYPGTIEQPEVGLHSMGDGAENVYFDDFGIRLNVSDTDILPSPIQQ